MHRIRVFLNPRASGSEKVESLIQKLKNRLFRSDIAVVSPENFETLRAELKKAVQDKVDVVVSVGGDGTVNTLIQNLGTTETAFLIIPAGTANDLARELGITERLDNALATIREGLPEKLDLIQVNDRFMVTNGGVGISADVASKVNELRSRIKGFKFTMSLFEERFYTLMLGFELLRKPLHYNDFEVESAEFSGRVHSPLVMINNQPALGGKFCVAPETHNNDGTFNVSIFVHEDKLSFLKELAQIRFKGRPAKSASFISFETKHLRLKPFIPVEFYGDGEVFETASDFDIRIRPESIRVFGARQMTHEVEKALDI